MQPVSLKQWSQEWPIVSKLTFKEQIETYWFLAKNSVKLGNFKAFYIAFLTKSLIYSLPEARPSIKDSGQDFFRSEVKELYKSNIWSTGHLTSCVHLSIWVLSNLFFFSVLLDDKVPEGVEPRFWEEEGFYVGKPPQVSPANLNIMENRIMDANQVCALLSQVVILTCTSQQSVES